MGHRSRLIAAGASIGLALMTIPLAPAAQAARPVERAAAAPVVKATMSAGALTLSTHTVRAGLITFKAVSQKGQRILQILQLHPGYTLSDLGADIGPAFGGDTAAIGRLDDNVTWLSGATATPKHPGWMQEKLTKGQYVALDQNGNGLDQFTVAGKVQKRTPVKTHGAITVFTYGFDTTPTTLTAGSWVRTVNQADQPHFIDMQQVKRSTTNAQVRKFIKSGLNGNPPWVLKADAGIGVISPAHGAAWRMDLPKGKYLMACFWPDRFSGMPHILMGMWKLVTLK